MTQIATVTLAGKTDMQQRLNSDGLKTLGLAGPLFALNWGPPQAVGQDFTLTLPNPWNAPLAGMLFRAADGIVPGLSLLNGSPAANGGAPAAVLVIHPQARLRLERMMVLALQPAGSAPADVSLRPVPARILVRNAGAAPAGQTAPGQNLDAGDAGMPGGLVSFHDERGLILDPLAFAAALVAVNAEFTGAGVTNAGDNAAGALTQLVPATAQGTFFHAVDLHGRPWSNPGAGLGIGLYSGSPLSLTSGGEITDGTARAWPAGHLLAPETDPGGTAGTKAATTIRVGWSTVGTMDTTALAWPAKGKQTPLRDTLRVAAVDLQFHLNGNRSGGNRDAVPGADQQTVADEQPLVRDGSPVALLADGRACLGYFGQVLNPGGGGVVIPQVLLAATPTFGQDAAAANWTLPIDPGPNGRWPASMPGGGAAVPLAMGHADLVRLLKGYRTSVSAQWVPGTNNVVLSFGALTVNAPAVLPNLSGCFLRVYPQGIVYDESPDNGPLLYRRDGGGSFLAANGAATLLLRNPYGLANGTDRPGAGSFLVFDLAVSYIAAAQGSPETVMLGALHVTPMGEAAAAPALPPANVLGTAFWKSIATSPILGIAPAGKFTLGGLVADPAALVAVLKQLATDVNPREAPRLPTMARNETLLAAQLANGADLFHGVLTGGWLTRETDRHTYRAGNPGGSADAEEHAPGAGASGQLGFDLWVAALHRARPMVLPLTAPTLQGLASNWLLLQTGAASTPPTPAKPGGSVAGALLQTVPMGVETPELLLIPAKDIAGVTDFINNTLGSTFTTGNDTEVHRQMVRELRSAQFGRRDAQWALRRAIGHARELIYIETPLLAPTSGTAGAPADAQLAVDLFAELANRLIAAPGLRVVLLTPRKVVFATAFAPYAAYFYAARAAVAGALQAAAKQIDGRDRVVVAHPVGMAGRPLVMRSTTVIVDDVWCMTGTSSLSRRGLTFDGGNDMVVVDRQLDRGAGVAVRAHRKALMGIHLASAAREALAGTPVPQTAQLHGMAAAHRLFADVLANGGEGKLLPLWAGPATPAAVPSAQADPDGSLGLTLANQLGGFLGGSV